MTSPYKPKSAITGSRSVNRVGGSSFVSYIYYKIML